MNPKIDRRALLGAALAVTGCAHRGAPADVVWEHHMISAGANRPDFNIETQINTQTLVALHQGRPLPEAGEEAAANLAARGFVNIEARGPRAAVLVVGLDDGARWFQVSQRATSAATQIIRRHASEIRNAINGIEGLSRLPWQNVSFFVLSDVLLDSWQINAVEQRWLGVERPQRSGGRYYYSVMARPANSEIEAFSIHGNQFFNYGDVAVGLYGNRRLSGARLPTLDASQLQALFGIETNEPQTVHAELARSLAVAARGSALPSSLLAGFQTLGLASGAGQVIVPVLHESEYFALNNVAGLIAPDLVALLEEERSSLRGVYASSRYVEEVSFEEYLIWWYHFFYTAVTNRLARGGDLDLPPNGTMTYVVTE